MDLIYVILSVFLRLSPAVRKQFIRSKSARGFRNDRMQLAIWVPLVGWVSVSVQHFSEATWLPWRVTGIGTDVDTQVQPDPKRRRDIGSQRRGSDLPPRIDMPD